MLIGTFRRNVGKLQSPKTTKAALRLVSRNTIRMQLAQSIMALKGHTGQLLRTSSPYLLGLQPTQEMKDEAFITLGDIGADLTALARVLKIKQPSTGKKVKLVGTRGAALLQLEGLASDLLLQASQSLFAAPKTSLQKKMVPVPSKGGGKEERDVQAVDMEAEQVVEMARREQIKALVSSTMDLYWRLVFDMTGQAPTAVFEAKVARLQVEHPTIVFDTESTPKAPKASKPLPAAFEKAKKAKKTPKPKAQEPVPA